METHFDTQIFVRDRIEVILVPKTSENLSNQDLLGKSTEMYKRDSEVFLLHFATKTKTNI